MGPAGRARAVVVALVVCRPLTAPLAAELDEGVNAYDRKDYATARSVFLDLAELGEARAQYDLGAMALRGEGVPRDRGEATGWMIAARENGYDPTPRKLDELVASSTVEERETAARVVARVGRAALERTVLPPRNGERTASTLRPPRLVRQKAPRYPEAAAASGLQALVIVRAVVDRDGHPRDPEVVAVAQSLPASPHTPAWVSAEGRTIRGEQRSFAEEALRAILERRYEPATLDGVPAKVTFGFRFVFRMADAPGFLKDGAEGWLRATAEAGDPRALFVLTMLGLSASGGEQTSARAYADGLLRAAQAGIPEAQHAHGAMVLRGGDPRRALPWLERAARAGSPAAQAVYGLALLRVPGASHAGAHDLLLRAAASDEPYAMRHAMAALACAREPAVRDPRAALEIARRARADAARDPLTGEAIAAAHAGAADFEAAVRAERAAIRRARELGWTVADMEQRLAAYEGRRACEQDFLPP